MAFFNPFSNKINSPAEDLFRNIPVNKKLKPFTAHFFYRKLILIIVNRLLKLIFFYF